MIVRLRAEVLSRLGIKSKDVISITNSEGKTVFAKCKLTHPDFLKPDGISMNQTARTNAKVAIGETVEVRKVRTYPAQVVTLIPVGKIPPISEVYIAQQIESWPVSIDDEVRFAYFHKEISFQIVRISPLPDKNEDDVVAIVGRETQVILLG
jgi:transitional endoplasmic reticulum ATPase